MADLQTLPETVSRSKFSMNTLSANFRSKIRFFPARSIGFCTCPVDLKGNQQLLVCSTKKGAVNGSRDRVRVGISDSQLKENWLHSLSCPFPEGDGQLAVEGGELESGPGPRWVVGIDPDAHGALALLKFVGSDCSAQVFDTPHLKVPVGKSVRRRLDTRSTVQLLHSFGAPLGTIAYIEQSTPYPQDGKQGWWSGGFTYGLWIGILVASGFSVMPVSSRLWKDRFELFGTPSSKDDSRKTASLLFPHLSSLLKRKKDHGRAEALLIAAYGKGLKEQLKSSAASESSLQKTKGSLEDCLILSLQKQPLATPVSIL